MLAAEQPLAERVHAAEVEAVEGTHVEVPAELLAEILVEVMVDDALAVGIAEVADAVDVDNAEPGHA